MMITHNAYKSIKNECKELEDLHGQKFIVYNGVIFTDGKKADEEE